MKKTLLLIACTTSLTVHSKEVSKGSQLHFLENKGQITDQYNVPRTDIDVAIQANGISAFVGNGEIHYQFYRTIDVEKATVATQRMDLILIGANKNATAILQEKQAYYERYYMPQFGEQGAIARSYNKVLYKDIYPGIDWLLYIKDNKLEHEFIVHEGADPGQIKIQYKGAATLRLQEDGSLNAHTPLGKITEAKPYCYTEANKGVASKYKLEGNVLSFDIASYTGTLIIDPTVIWGTYYYGATNSINIYGIATHGTNIYMAGASPYCEGLATIGAYQDTLNDGLDGVIVKFDSAGNRLWCTYYGGENSDGVSDIATDSAGNIYICGGTFSSSAMATLSSHQPVYSDSGDCYIAKFNSTGDRIWSTYLGGDKIDVAYSIHSAANRIYVCGNTKSTTNIASTSAHQAVLNGINDDFLAVFDTSGTRIWSTYYGGELSEGTLSDVYADHSGNVFLGGVTPSTTGIATPGSHQPVKEPLSDGYLVKFSNTGTRLWGTYYGGESPDPVFGVVCDHLNNVYIGGATGTNQPGSSYNIATTNGLQPMPGGGADIYLAKFTPSGERVWGTYYGDTGIEIVFRHFLSIDQWDNLYISGQTTSPAIPGQQYLLQSMPGGSSGLILKLDSAGQQAWASYYGGAGTDRIFLSAPDNLGNVYFAGTTTSDSNIATPGSYLPIDTIFGGAATPFLVRVYDTLPPLNIVASSSENGLRLYPNPSQGMITIESASPAEVVLYGIDGRIVMQMNIKKGRTFINLRDGYAAGVYFATFKFPNGKEVTEKIEFVR